MQTTNTKRLIVLSAPSGAGKTTVAHRLLERNPLWQFSVSATTRQRRTGETDGSDYRFLTPEQFRQAIADGDLVEWEEIYGNLYGTLKSEIRRALQTGGNLRMIFDIDVRGALAVRRAFPNDAFLVFLAPPSMQELRQRLEGRHTENPESLRRRIERAQMEMEMQSQFDAVVVNDELERAVEQIETIVTT